MTAQAALHTILGQFDKAMSALNEVLRNDSSHFLALIRRSQLYKKVELHLVRRESSIEHLMTLPLLVVFILITCKLPPCVWKLRV